MSPDRKHDHNFVKHANKIVIDYYRDLLGGEVKGLHIWSDGCKTQFKLKAQFYWVTGAAQEYGFPIEHCFFSPATERARVTGSVLS